MKRQILAIVPFLLAATFLLSGLLGAFPFGSDEGDNMLGALTVARGGDIYKDFFSQHTPFPYYFMSVFALLGVDSIIGFRLAFAAALLVFWLVLYWAYAGVIPKTTLRFFVVAYPLLAPFCLGHLILAEVFTVHALVVLLVEYLRYLETRTLTPGRMAIISLCVFVAVMSSFVSVYAVSMIMLGFGIGELKGLSRAAFRVCLRRWLLFLAVLSMPFVLLLSWYAVTGNLRNFYEQAYLFNRAVYSRYVGVGTSAIAPLIYLPIGWFLHSWRALTGGAVTLGFLLAGVNLLFLAGLLRRRPLAALVVMLFLAATGIRGYEGQGLDGFHSMPYYIVSLFIFGLVLSWMDRAKPWAWLAGLGLLLLFLGVTVPVYANSAKFSLTKLRHDPLFPTPYDSCIRKYTRETDRIWTCGINAYCYVGNRRMPACRLWGLTPWFAEKYGDTVIADLTSNRPPLIILDPKYRVWGHDLHDYGSNILSYINANYQPLDQSDPVKREIYLLK